MKVHEARNFTAQQVDQEISILPAKALQFLSSPLFLAYAICTKLTTSLKYKKFFKVCSWKSNHESDQHVSAQHCCASCHVTTYKFSILNCKENLIFPRLHKLSYTVSILQTSLQLLFWSKLNLNLWVSTVLGEYIKWEVLDDRLAHLKFLSRLSFWTTSFIYNADHEPHDTIQCQYSLNSTYILT